MNALADSKHFVTQHYYVSIPGTQHALSVASFRLEEAFNTAFHADIVVTSADLAISGAGCIGRWAYFQIEGEAPPMPGMKAAREMLRTVHGVITEWEHVSSSRDEACYRLRLEPRFALLRQTTDSRVFLDTCLKDLLIDSVVERKVFEPFDVECEFEQPQVRLEQVLMYEESIDHFIGRHCRKAGVFFYFKHADDAQGARRDTLVFADSAKGYVRALEVPVAEHAGLESAGREAIHTLRTVRVSVPETISLWDYNYRTPDDTLTAQASVAHDDRSVSGTLRRSTEHHRTRAQGEAVAALRRDELIARQTRYRGTGNVVRMMPGMVVRLTNRALPDAKYGIVITRVISQGGRDQPFYSEFEAMPSHLPFRPHYDAQLHWRWMPGPVRAVVESRYADEYAHPDEQGRYYVRFGFDWRASQPGFGSKPLRLLRPTASYRGGFHAPKLPGTEVRIGFTGGDIDQPFILGAAHDYARTDVVYGMDGWNTRSVWRTPLRRNDIRMEDYKGQEGVKIATVFAKSSVSLGYLVDGARAQRGTGLEARTDGHAVLRGGAGVLLTADRQGEPDRPHLEMQGAWTQLQAALAQAAALSEVARRATAELAQVKAQQAQLETAFQDLREAVVLLSAPHGIGVATPKSIQLASGEHVAVGAGGSADFSLGQSLTVAAQQAVSLLAVHGGVKVLAQQGKVDVQAQGGAMRLFAEEDVKITSADGHVAIDAAKSITLRAGGICLKLERGNVTLMCPGDFKVHTASFCSKGPMSVQEQGREAKEVGDLHVTCHDSNGEPMAGEALSLLDGEGRQISLSTDADGHVSQADTVFEHFKSSSSKRWEEGNGE